MKKGMKLVIDSDSANEAFARTVVAAYVTRLDPTLEELADIKTAVSEAVTNSILHGYGGREGEITVSCKLQGKQIEVVVRDEGIGIEDIEKAMEPLYTTKPEWERSGMGFAFMEAFMDELQVDSEPGNGTTVIMRKEIGRIQSVE
ncbi:MAG: anti-sigma F factor [Lachnospiraceae bacterium]|nr:anti-sigma F factor [Lachnospiraceae bacterium]